MIPHLQTVLRKAIFTLTGRLFLMDGVRNFTYQWAWSYLKTIPRGASLLDIGTRNSSFAAFLSWRGFNVTALDPDSAFLAGQADLQKRWGTGFETIKTTVTDFNPGRQFDCITAIFSLQHAGEGDIAACGHAARLLNPGGLLLIVNEYRHSRTEFLENRVDGTLRRYSKADIESRIIAPVAAAGLAIMDKQYADARFDRSGIGWTNDPEKGTVCFVSAKKRYHLT